MSQQPPKRTPKTSPSTSWEPVEKWYSHAVGNDGHYYHQQIVLPGVLRLLDMEQIPNPSLLDLGCGSGVLSRQLPNHVIYTGIDISPSLISVAKKQNTKKHHEYLTSDVTKPLPIKKADYTHAAIILALQNMRQGEQAIRNAAKHMLQGGKLVIAMNHPCFRIPRQSHWKIDEAQKIQYRRIDRYASALEIPIQANPSKGNDSSNTWSFHHSLADYSSWLQDSGFAIERLEEWYSDKVSTGKAAKMENRSREEFPLFLAIKAVKIRN